MAIIFILSQPNPFPSLLFHSLALFSNFTIFCYVDILPLLSMASSDNSGSSHTSLGSSNPSTNASVVAISPCTTSFQYSLSIVENIFPPLGASWVSDHHITPKPRFAEFSM